MRDMLSDLGLSHPVILTVELAEVTYSAEIADSVTDTLFIFNKDFALKAEEELANQTADVTMHTHTVVPTNGQDFGALTSLSSDDAQQFCHIHHRRDSGVHPTITIDSVRIAGSVSYP